MSKYIAIIAAVAAIGLFYFRDNLNLPLLNIRKADPVGAMAWSVFERYVAYAEDKNLEGVKSLSHQVSDTCKRPESKSECEQLMENVALIARGYEKEDFKYIYYDERQIVMMTDQIETADKDALSQIVLFFTRTDKGDARVLGLRFCFKMLNELGKGCFNPDPSVRDLDQNGWWDAVESLFYK